MTGPGSPPLAGRAGWGRPLLAWRRVHDRARSVATHHAGTRVVRLALGIRRRWLRSLQLRVVATTMLLGTLVVFAVGSVLLAGIWKGLVDSRQEAAFTEAARMTDDAENSFSHANVSDADSVNNLIKDTVNQAQGAVDQKERAVVLVRAETTPVQVGYDGGGHSGGVQIGDIPADLRAEVNLEARQQSQLFPLPAADAPGASGPVPAIGVGSIVNVPLAGRYEMYFVFRLDREMEILRLVQRTFVIGGFALVLLVGAVAYVVTRQVVAPVRQAAMTAEELASGLLDRRMRVRGQDDLARLGRAFNEMAASLERQIHRLEELSRVQRRFVSDVSHELRTPLTTIRMASEVIYESREEFDPATARSAELLQAQLDRFEALLGDLLEISRFDAGAAVLELEPVDLRELVTRIVEGLGPLAERRDTSVQVRLPAEACIAEVDSRRVERIVRNLLVNAIEHGEGQRVEVTMAADDTQIAVGVLDHGVGLRPGELQMVFNRFWRADPARARNIGGTGLGLAIALEDAHLHGGWLQVWGESGVGAHFRLTLPRGAGMTPDGSPLPLVPFPQDASDGQRIGDRHAVAPAVAPAGPDRLDHMDGAVASAMPVDARPAEPEAVDATSVDASSVEPVAVDAVSVDAVSVDAVSVDAVSAEGDSDG